MVNTKIAPVYIVNCIDTEGPLNEPITSTFQRIKDICNVDEIPYEYNWHNLNRILNNEIKLKDKFGKEISKILSPHLLNYNNSWDKIHEMFSDINRSDLRFKLKDSNNNGWKFTFHILDHVSYKNNPRRRTLGYNAIYDEYLDILNRELGDELEFHFHPMNQSRDAHRCATAYDFDDNFNQILCRRLIDREFFPSSFRAGFQAIRPDSNLLLEQWIPFDISNMSEEKYEYLFAQKDFHNGRSGDWRGAVNDWSIYSPSIRDWRLKGDLNRKIGRALNPLNRIGSLTQKEVNKAFETASKGIPAVLGIACHDFRDIRREIEFCQGLISNASELFKDVPFYFESTRLAFRKALNLKTSKAQPVITIYWDDNDYPELCVDIKDFKMFMIQPYLAIKLNSNSYFRDNFNFSRDGKYFYAFYFDTVELDQVDSLGIALTSYSGEVWTAKVNKSTLIDLKPGKEFSIIPKYR